MCGSRQSAFGRGLALGVSYDQHSTIDFIRIVYHTGGDCAYPAAGCELDLSFMNDSVVSQYSNDVSIGSKTSCRHIHEADSITPC